LSNQVSPGERNPIEGKFGQAKTTYGLNRIKARLAQTSESWVASIILVLNLVNLAERVRFCQMFFKLKNQIENIFRSWALKYVIISKVQREFISRS
jgi:hypothetical protein